MRRLSIAVESFALAAPFVISRGAKSEAVVVTVTLQAGDSVGRGECVPYGRYGETPESVVAHIESCRARMEAGLDRQGLLAALPAGAARNALDAALWDLDAKELGLRAQTIAGLHRLSPVTTAFTLSVNTPEAMAQAAATERARPLLKLKLGGGNDAARIAAVRAAAPDADLIVDANEACTPETLPALFAACRAAQVRLIEQPLPEGQDAALRDRPRDIPVCADESVHELDDLAALGDRYDAVNIKLDKAGGLTHALEMARAAQALGLAIVVGSMVGTSLGMAPALLLAPLARFVDLDGPLLLKEDRRPGLRYDGSILYPPEPALWADHSITAARRMHTMVARAGRAETLRMT